MSDTHPFRRPAIRRRLLLALVALIALGLTIALDDVLSFDRLAGNRERLVAFADARPVSVVVAFLAVYVVIAAFSLPGATVTTLAGGFLFGVFPGTLYNVLGATVGATLLFLAVRWGLGARLAARMDAGDGQVKRIKAGIDRNQWEMLFLIRLIPVVPFFVANLLPALLGVGLGRFVTTTFLGIIPGALVYTSVGAGLGAVFDAGEAPDLDVIFEPRILLPLVGLAALAALPMALRAWRGRRAA
ncbi:MAG: TVP38/TMEM64 family protein [Tranquillimonas sp.]